MQWKLGIESCALTQLDPCLVILKPQHVVVKNCLQIHLIRGDLAGAIEAARQAQQVPHLYGIVKYFDVRHRQQLKHGLAWLQPGVPCLIQLGVLSSRWNCTVAPAYGIARNRMKTEFSTCECTRQVTDHTHA